MGRGSGIRFVHFNMIVALVLLVVSSFSTRPEAAGINPIECSPGSGSCILNNYQGVWTDREPCVVSSVAYPTTEEELVAAVAGAVRRKQSIKVVSKLVHSIPKLACPRGRSGLLISTSKYDSNIVVDEASKTVTVDAGVELQYLFAKLAEHSLALPNSPSFNGISVAGVISTGAHGSSLHGKGGAVHESIVAMSIVVPASRSEGYAKVVKLTSADQDLNAAKLSIGVLGAISTVTFAVEAMFKRSVTKMAKNDSSLEDDILEVAKNYEFGEINWHINQGRTIHTLSQRVPVSTPGNGRNINYTPRLGSSVKFFRELGEQWMASENATQVCAASLTSIDSRVGGGDGNWNDDTGFKGYPVIGFNNLMETGGGCQNTGLNNTVTTNGDKLTCPWDTSLPGQIFFETGVSIPLYRIKEVIRDIKKLRNKNPDKLCGPNLYGGTIFRFVRGSSAYLASPHDSVYFDMLFFRHRNSSSPRLDEDAMEELQQMLLQKYNARPHWGKNQDFAFEKVGSKVTSLSRFLEVKKRMDPHGYFSSEWSDAVLGIRKKGSRKVSIVRDRCALEGLCVCSLDKHCDPEKGYLCKRGVFYKGAKVCRKAL